jgi:hypothetical protein
MDTAVSLEINMLNTLRNKSMWGARLKGVVAALLFAGSGAALAANVTVNLCAKTGTVSLPVAPLSVPILGYASGPCSGSAAITAPGGPVIYVNVGDVVTVNLENSLSKKTGLLFQGQSMVPDTMGADAAIVSANGAKSYTFTASTPGTFLYEAAPLSNAEHQVAMGLSGALIVRPARTDANSVVTSGSDVVNDAAILATDVGATVSGVGIPAGTTITAVTPGDSFTMSALATASASATDVTVTLHVAYNAAAATFRDEAVLVLSELDPALNTSADPAAFDMRKYAPKYFLINGKFYPDTAPIASAAGNKVLLRYVNAGAKHHSMGVLGLRQVFVAKDASTLPTLNHNVAAETLAPGQTGDAILTIPATATNASRFAVYDAGLALHNSNAAGMGGMLTFVTATGATTVAGPAVTALALTGQTALTATIAASAGRNVTNWQYWIDSGAPTTTAITPAPTANVSATIPVQPTGNHNLYVRGQDDASPTGTWGAIRTLSFAVDTTGPVTGGLTLTPNPSNGSVSVTLSATGNDTTTGGSNVTAAEYTVVGGTAGTMTMGGAAAPVRSLTATIPAGLSVGAHTVAVRSQDALGNWGAYTNITLNVVAAGPVTSAVTASKNPNNGVLPLNSSQPVVRVTATVASTGSAVVAAEGFIDSNPAITTRGFPFLPSDASWNGASESVYADIPLATINALAAGSHTIYVRGKDAAGNWGNYFSTNLLIDKTAPTFTGISVSPSPTLGAANVTLTVNGAADTGGAGVAGGEYWIDPPTTTNPAPGSGTPFNGSTATIPVSALANGSYTVRVRVRDAAGNWSSGNNGIRQATLFVAPDAIFSDGFETGGRPWGWSDASTNTTSRLNATALAALVGARGLQAQGNNNNYVQYDFGNANPASPTFDGRFYFNPNGNTGTNQDIFVARTTGGNTVFRVRYRWNGGSPQVQIQVGTGNGNAAWASITNGPNSIEVVWQSGSTLQLYVGGTLSQTLTATNTSVGQFRLGSVTNGGSNIFEYFDGMSAKRSVTPLFGP